MIDFKGIILKLEKFLYPTGRAFKASPGSVLEAKYEGLIITKDTAYNEALSILDSILPDNDNFTEADAIAWERRLGLRTGAATTLDDRKAAILRKMNHPGTDPSRQHFLYLQGELQKAGFDLFVFENRFPGPVTKPPSDFITAPPGPQHGDSQHGDIQTGLGNFPKIVNHLEQIRDDQFRIGDNLRSTFYIGGTPIGTVASIPPSRELEFRKLVLNIKPVHTVAFLIIDFFLEYTEFLSLETLGSGDLTTPTEVKVVGNKLYVVDFQIRRVFVYDLTTGNQIVAEKFGDSQLASAIGLDIVGNKAYVCSEFNGEVFVYDITTQAEIVSEKFGSGVLSAPNYIQIVNGKAYITDSGDSKVYVFDVATGAHLSGEDFGSALNVPFGIAIVGNKGYVPEFSGSQVRVYDITTQTELVSEKFGVGVLNGPTNIKVQNNRAYVVDFTDEIVYVFSTIDGAHLSTEDFGSGDINAPQAVSFGNAKAFVSDSLDDDIKVFKGN